MIKHTIHSKLRDRSTGVVYTVHELAAELAELHGRPPAIMLTIVRSLASKTAIGHTGVLLGVRYERIGEARAKTARSYDESLNELRARVVRLEAQVMRLSEPMADRLS